MKKQLLIATVSTMVATLIVIFAILLDLNSSPQDVLVSNQTNHDYKIAYYASTNGQWISTSDRLIHNHLNQAAIYNNNFINAAYYQIAVGNRLGKFYCTAEIEQPAFGQPAKFISNNGHCNATTMLNGKLALTVTPI